MKYFFYGTLIISDILLPNFDAFISDGSQPIEIEDIITIKLSGHPLCSIEGSCLFKYSLYEVWKSKDQTLYYVSRGQIKRCSVRQISENSLEIYNYNEEELKSKRELNHLIRAFFESRNLKRGMVSLHASCIDIKGCGVAFTATSGTGKSTRSNVWKQVFKASILSGDRPALRVSSADARSIVFLGMPWDGKEQIFKNLSVPAKAILEVRRSKRNVIRELTDQQKFTLLQRHCFIPDWDPVSFAHGIILLRKISQNVSIYRCFCGPDENSAKAVYRTLFFHQEEILPPQEDILLDDSTSIIEFKNNSVLIGKSNHEQGILLNNVTHSIYNMLEFGISKEDLLCELYEQYNVDFNTLQSDVNGILSSFKEYGIIK